MSRILLCWEMGANLGHMQRMLPIALALGEAGNEVRFALRDLSRSERVIGPHGFPCFQAPVWLPRVVNPPPSWNYASVLVDAGWLDENGLLGLTKGWMHLYDGLGADLVVADHAPTALLAARAAGRAAAALGNGFEIPPLEDPLPPMDWWLDNARRPPPEAERLALIRANAVLARLGRPPMAALMDLFRGAPGFITCWPELDHYPARGEAEYLGPILAAAGGAPPRWPMGEGARIFAYVMPEYRDFAELMRLLRSLGSPALVHAPGLAPLAAAKLESATLAFSAAPLDMAEITRSARLVIAHGPGTATTALLAGIPTLQLPTHMEQLMVAKRLAGMGLSLCHYPKEPGANLKKSLRRILDEPDFAAAAGEFAERHRDFSSIQVAREIAGRCAALANSLKH